MQKIILIREIEQEGQDIVLDRTAVSKVAFLNSDFLTPGIHPPTNGIHPPTNLSAEAGDTEVFLNWSPSTSEIDSYTVYVFNTLSQQLEQVIEGIQLAEADVMGLTNDVEYEFWIVAVKGNIISEPSNRVSATPIQLQPEPPTNVQVEVVEVESNLLCFRRLDASKNQFFSLPHNSTLADIKSIFMLIEYVSVNNVENGDPVIHKDGAGANEGDFVFNKGGTFTDDYFRCFIQGSSTMVLGDSSRIKTVAGQRYSVGITLGASNSKMYIDAKNTATSISKSFSMNTRDLIVGFRSGFYWDGKMYYLGLFNEELSAEEINELHNFGVGLPYDDLSAELKSKLISYYNMDEGTGNAIDSHGDNDLEDNNGITGECVEIPPITDINLYIITDTHLREGVDGNPENEYAGDASARSYYAAHSKVRNFVDIANNDEPDAVFHLGDIGDGFHGDSQPDFTFFNEEWGKLNANVKKVTVGNHDFDKKTYEELVGILGYEENDEIAGSKFNETFVIDKNGFKVRFIFADSNFDSNNDHANVVQGRFTAGTLNWIDSILTTMEESLCVICSHHVPHTYNRSTPHFLQSSATTLRNSVNSALVTNPHLSKVISIGGHSHTESIVEHNNLGSLIGYQLPDSIEGRGNPSVSAGCITLRFNNYTGEVSLLTKNLNYPYPEE